MRKRSIVTPCARKVRIQCGPLPAADQAEARPFSTAQRCGMQPQAMCSIEVKEKAKRTKTKDNNKKRMSCRGMRGRRNKHHTPTTKTNKKEKIDRQGRETQPGHGAEECRDGHASDAGDLRCVGLFVVFCFAFVFLCFFFW